MRRVYPSSCSNRVMRNLGRSMVRRRQDLGEIRTSTETFLWSYETRFPVASGPFLVGHVDDWNCSQLLGRSVRFEVCFVPVQGCINRIAANDCYTKLVPIAGPWIDMELGRVRI